MKSTTQKVKDVKERIELGVKKTKTRTGFKSVQYNVCKKCNHHKSFFNERVEGTYNNKCCKCGLKN